MVDPVGLTIVIVLFIVFFSLFVIYAFILLFKDAIEAVKDVISDRYRNRENLRRAILSVIFICLVIIYYTLILYGAVELTINNILNYDDDNDNNDDENFKNNSLRNF